MVDAADLKSAIRMGVRVRVPPSAPVFDYHAPTAFKNAGLSQNAGLGSKRPHLTINFGAQSLYMRLCPGFENLLKVVSSLWLRPEIRERQNHLRQVLPKVLGSEFSGPSLPGW